MKDDDVLDCYEHGRRLGLSESQAADIISAFLSGEGRVSACREALRMAAYMLKDAVYQTPRVPIP